jgi:pyruvate formate lyase activating enzyme
MREAQFYTLNDKTIKCNLCHLHCTINIGKKGVCGVRTNISSTLYTNSFKKLVAVSADPIEKKPLFHIAPGSKALSFAAAGCNFHCPWCQNSNISQNGKPGQRANIGETISPQQIVAEAYFSNSRVVAATYTEPTIFYELAYDVAQLAKESGFLNVWVTNGSITLKPLEKIAPYLSGANVDLKGSNHKTTQKITGLGSDYVMDTIRAMKNLGIWVEVTTLIVTGVNDSSSELEGIANFISSVDPSMPWHISRYFPSYKMNAPATSIETLAKAQKIGIDAGLKFIYSGNHNTENGENTNCPSCNSTVIVRNRYTIVNNSLMNGAKCPHCGQVLPGIEMTF